MDGLVCGFIVEFGSIDCFYSCDNIDCDFDMEFCIVVFDDGGFVVVWCGSYNDYSGMMIVGC